MADKFISGAIKRPGHLRAWIRRMYGDEGFDTHDGRMIIKPRILAKVARGKCPICDRSMGRCVCPSKLTRKEARFAEELREFNHRRAWKRTEQ